MNHSLFPRPRYWAQAAEQIRNPRGIFGLTMTLLIMMLIASLIESLVSALILSGVILIGHTEDALAFFSSGPVTFDDAAKWLASMTPDWYFYVLLFCEIFLILTVLIYCTKIEKRRPATLGLIRKHCVTEYLLGVVIGAALFSGVFFLGKAAGAYRIGSIRFTPRLLLMLCIGFLGYMIQGAAEELMVRGFFAVSMNKRYPTAFCVFVSSLLFALFHLGNNAAGVLPILNTFLVGLFLCMYILKRGSIWGAFAIHSVWNFTQGLIYGFPVSGLPAGDSLIRPLIRQYNDLTTGGDYGPEGSICTTIILLAALIAVFALKPRGEIVPEEKPKNEKEE